MAYDSEDKQKAWRAANRDKINEQARLRRKLNPEEHATYKRNSDLKNKFGISLIKYKEMYKKQNNVCAICKLPEPASRGLAVDHCETVNGFLIRGLLCTNCNQGLGQFKDNIDFLKSAIQYLEKFL